MKFSNSQEMYEYLFHRIQTIAEFFQLHTLTEIGMEKEHNTLYLLDEGWYVTYTRRFEGQWVIIHINEDGEVYWLKGYHSAMAGARPISVPPTPLNFGHRVNTWNAGLGWNTGTINVVYSFNPSGVLPFINWRTDPLSSRK